MNKRYLHHVWTGLRPIKTWYFLAAMLLCGLVSVVALRDNNTTMASLRTAVYQADEQNKDVVSALQKLRAHVNGHMNTSLVKNNSSVYPPIQLTATYQRLQKAEQDRVNSANSQIYTDAQKECERRFPGSFSGGPRVPCIEQYVKDHGTSIKPIPQELYKFNFATPRWSPDLAGWTLALTALLATLTVLRFLLGRILQSLSR